MFAESLRVKHIELSGQYELAKHSGGRMEEIANLAGQVQALEWAIEEYEKLREDEEDGEELSFEEIIEAGSGVNPLARIKRNPDDKSMTIWEVPPMRGAK